jgi:hypothetical protein
MKIMGFLQYDSFVGNALCFSISEETNFSHTEDESSKLLGIIGGTL